MQRRIAPTSNRDQVAICGETGLYAVRWVNGVEVYAHGYGIELTFPDLAIDFDRFRTEDRPGSLSAVLTHFFPASIRKLSKYNRTHSSFARTPAPTTMRV